MVVSLKQFRDRYPAASLTSDLLMVQGEQFVVKVTIHTQAAGTATGMAADAHLEIAEDRARQRALEALEGTAEPLQALPELSLSTPLAPKQATVKPLPEPKLAGETVSLLAIPSHGEITPGTEVDSFETSELLVSRPSLTAPVTAPQQDKETVAVSPPKKTTVASDRESVPSAITPKPLTAPDENVPAAVPDMPDLETLPAPVNLSDVIAQTDVELSRLGWSVADGREYLESTYGKRSRHDLTDEELLAFLLHLEALPDPHPIGGVDGE